jgi:hypothetical protein
LRLYPRRAFQRRWQFGVIPGVNNWPCPRSTRPGPRRAGRCVGGRPPRRGRQRVAAGPWRHARAGRVAGAPGLGRVMVIRYSRRACPTGARASRWLARQRRGPAGAPPAAPRAPGPAWGPGGAVC